jgi:hypothetical protein
MRKMFPSLKNNLLALSGIFIILICLFAFAIKSPNETKTEGDEHTKKLLAPSLHNLKAIHAAPLIFIGGSQRSGTTLMRALLDVHDSIKCGTEVTHPKK